MRSSRFNLAWLRLCTENFLSQYLFCGNLHQCAHIKSSGTWSVHHCEEKTYNPVPFRGYICAVFRTENLNLKNYISSGLPRYHFLYFNGTVVTREWHVHCSWRNFPVIYFNKLFDWFKKNAGLKFLFKRLKWVERECNNSECCAKLCFCYLLSVHQLYFFGCCRNS